MLPFLKNKQEGGMSGPVETITREPDHDESFEMLDAIAEDMMDAFKKDDRKLLKGALDALVEHIRDMDQDQDFQEMQE